MEEQEHQLQIPEEKKRPTFLLVLCILSWVSAGFSILSEIYALISPNVLRSILKEQIDTYKEKAAAGGELADMYYALVDYNKALIANFQPYHLSSLLLAVMSCLAVYQMFRMKKSGFFVYSFVQLLMLILPFIFIVNLATVASGIFMGIFTLAFVIMYAVNLKHMD